MSALRRLYWRVAWIKRGRAPQRFVLQSFAGLACRGMKLLILGKAMRMKTKAAWSAFLLVVCPKINWTVFSFLSEAAYSRV
jgi:hypothetical protein